MPIKQLMYCSCFRFPDEQLEPMLSVLLPRAVTDNLRAGITGCLTYGAGWFLQVLEGEPAKVKSLMDRIRGDHRHGDIKIIFDRHIRGRSFPEWSMIPLDLAECRAAFEARGLSIGHFLPTSAPPLSLLLSLMDSVDRRRLTA